jgi:hypothetical protein
MNHTKSSSVYSLQLGSPKVTILKVIENRMETALMRLRDAIQPEIRSGETEMGKLGPDRSVTSSRGWSHDGHVRT